jgi:uncharacterized membrane protein YkvA (DUF1232 family)
MASAARPKGGTRTRRPAGPPPTPDVETERAGIPRTGAKRTVMYYVKQFPAYLRLLGGLLADRRVNALDKLLVAGAIAYIVMPIDIIPDFIPFLGEVDDVFLLVTALQRLIGNAGRKIVGQYWQGPMSELDPTNLRRVLTAAAFFLPRRMRRRLRAIGR